MMNVRGTFLGTSVDMWSGDGGLSKVFKNFFDNFQVGQTDKNKLEWYISKVFKRLNLNTIENIQNI